jgi:hypothetical protein
VGQSFGSLDVATTGSVWERRGGLGEGGLAGAGGGDGVLGGIGAAFAIANNSKRIEQVKIREENMMRTVQVLAAGEHSEMDCQRKCRAKDSRVTLRQPLEFAKSVRMDGQNEN